MARRVLSLKILVLHFTLVLLLRSSISIPEAMAEKMTLQEAVKMLEGPLLSGSVLENDQALRELIAALKAVLDAVSSILRISALERQS